MLTECPHMLCVWGVLAAAMSPHMRQAAHAAKPTNLTVCVRLCHRLKTRERLSHARSVVFAAHQI